MMGCILLTMGHGARGETACTFFTSLGIMSIRSEEEVIATFLVLGEGFDLLALRRFPCVWLRSVGAFLFFLGALARFSSAYDRRVWLS